MLEICAPQARKINKFGGWKCDFAIRKWPSDPPKISGAYRRQWIFQILSRICFPQATSCKIPLHHIFLTQCTPRFGSCVIFVCHYLHHPFWWMHNSVSICFVFTDSSFLYSHFSSFFVRVVYLLWHINIGNLVPCICFLAINIEHRILIS